MSMNSQALLKRATDAVVQNLAGDEGAVLLHLGSGQYHTLNPVGARIWEILEKPMSKAELTRRVEAEFAVSSDAVSSDVEEFLQGLVERKLVLVESEA